MPADSESFGRRSDERVVGIRQLRKYPAHKVPHAYRMCFGMLQTILRRAHKRKELHRAVNLDCVVNMLVGAFYARYLATSTVPPDFARELVAIIWPGIAVKPKAKAKTTPKSS